MKKSGKRKSTRLNAKKVRVSKKGSICTTRATLKKTGSQTSTGGRRKGTKRSDLRFIAPDGSEWASPFEFRVFTALNDAGLTVRRTTPADALSYMTPVKNGGCISCGCEGSCIVQNRVYTPDLVVLKDWHEVSGGYIERDKPIYLETKGYFPASKRNLFRAARQNNPQVDVRLIVSSNHWVTKGKTRLTDWAKRFKIPIHVWDGKLPEDWL